jgi:hypothetical protein
MSAPHQDGAPAAADAPPTGSPGGWRARARAAAQRVREPVAVLAGTPQALGLVWGAHRGLATLLVAISAVQGLLPLAHVWLTTQIIDAVAGALGLGAPPAAAGGAALLPPGAGPRVAALLAGVGVVALLISHRFSTVRMADAIVVLDRGRVIEQGSHDRLMARAGTYARLFTMQAERYR